MTILGIETSCDETAAAVVEDGRRVISNVVYTQIPMHKPYGGVVPELASRAHIEKIGEVLEETLRIYQERRPGGKIDAVAVTYGPGLSPALIVGLNAAKGVAHSLGVELICINHLEAHLHTPFLFDDGDESLPPSPENMGACLGLVVSGGHTNWVDIPEYGHYETIGQTLDDAAGEAFDKAAKLLNLGYPGGPVIDKIARTYQGDDFIPFPKGRPRPGVSSLSGLSADLCVSFSGLKTALLRYVQKSNGAEALEKAGEIPRVVASYQRAIVGALADRTATALKMRPRPALIVGGGVSLNASLRSALEKTCRRTGTRLLLAKPKYCGDNGAMIAALAYYRRNITGKDAFATDVSPSLEVGAEIEA